MQWIFGEADGWWQCLWPRKGKERDEGSPGLSWAPTSSLTLFFGGHSERKLQNQKEKAEERDRKRLDVHIDGGQQRGGGCRTREGFFLLLVNARFRGLYL